MSLNGHPLNRDQSLFSRTVIRSTNQLVGLKLIAEKIYINESPRRRQLRSKLSTAINNHAQWTAFPQPTRRFISRGTSAPITATFTKTWDVIRFHTRLILFHANYKFPNMNLKLRTMNADIIFSISLIYLLVYLILKRYLCDRCLLTKLNFMQLYNFATFNYKFYF